jgi:hypothetical protein
MGANPPLTQEHSDTDPPIVFDRLLDWAIGALLAIVGLLTGLVGGALFVVVDRPQVATLIDNSEFSSEILTEPEAVDALAALAHWSGLGLLTAGGMTVLVGIGVVVAHGRARADSRATPRWILGVIGAIVGALLGFVPFSPALGGAVAGYLDPNPTASGLGAGLLAGVFAALPVFVITIFGSVGLAVGLPNGVVVPATVVVAVGIFLSLVYLVGLSALGGYVGGRFRDR